MKLGQGYVFTCVCDSVHGGLYSIVCWDTPPKPEAGTPLGPVTPRPEAGVPPTRYPPDAVHAGRYGQ